MRVTIEAPTLAPYQRAIDESTARFKVVEASTKSGKTFYRLWATFRKAHEKGHKPGANVWWIAPTYSQAKIAFGRMQRWVAMYPKAYKVNLSDLTIVTPMDITIAFKTAERPDNLYGEDVIDATFDEFTRAREEAWFALRSTLTATGGGCTFIGNYTGGTSWGHRLIEEHRDDPQWQYWRITADEAVSAGILSKAEVEQAKRDLPHAVYMALYECEGVHDPTMLIRYDAIQRLWSNDKVPPGETVITADIARYGSDKTVIGIWSGYRLKHIHTMEHTATNHTAACIMEYMRMEGCAPYNVIIDEDGVGGGVVDLVPGCQGFQGGSRATWDGQGVNYRNLKSQSYYELAALINADGMHIEVEEHRDSIVQELCQVKIGDVDAEGKLSVAKKKLVKQALGRSPDLSDMMMMRMLPTHEAVGNAHEAMRQRVDMMPRNDIDFTFEERID